MTTIMLAVAEKHTPYRWRMDRADEPTPTAQRDAMARAIKRLRESIRENGKEISPPKAARRAGISAQAWRNYEAGDRQIILQQDVQDQLAKALGSDRRALLTLYHEELGAGRVVDFPGGLREPPARAFELPITARARAGPRSDPSYDAGEPTETVDFRWMFGGEVSALRVAGDSMTGYADSGDMVIFDRRRWPRKGQGCVIETNDGGLYVKEYVGMTETDLILGQRFPETQVTFALSDVKGVYAIRFRGD